MAETAPVSISMDLSNVKTTIPIIADNRWVKVRLANLGQTANDKGQMLVFEYHLLEPAPTTDGETVKPGFPIFERITLYSKDTPPGQIPEFAQTKICKRVDAILKTGDPNNKLQRPTRPAFNGELIPSLIGQPLYLQLKAKTGGEYEGNEVVKVMHVDDMPAA